MSKFDVMIRICLVYLSAFISYYSHNFVSNLYGFISNAIQSSIDLVFDKVFNYDTDSYYDS